MYGDLEINPDLEVWYSIEEPDEFWPGFGEEYHDRLRIRLSTNRIYTESRRSSRQSKVTYRASEPVRK